MGFDLLFLFLGEIIRLLIVILACCLRVRSLWFLVSTVFLLLACLLWVAILKCGSESWTWCGEWFRGVRCAGLEVEVFGG